ncbi:MAG: hypothetical protein WCX46_00555 [Candidatus Paceibacterota bacterium]
MIYLFTGDDNRTKRKAYKKFIELLPKGLETFFISKNNFNRTQIESLYSGSGLFFTKCAVFFENIFEKEDHLDFILEKLELICGSQNDFIFLESKLNKPILDAFKKVRAELNIFELPKDKKEKYNNFLLADALADRNKFQLWLHFRFAMDRGVRMEELIGILFWKVKDMILKKNFYKFSEIELKSFATKISYLLQEARKNGADDESAFEQFILEAF